MERSNTTALAVASFGSEKIFIDSKTNEVYVQYIGPADM